MADTKAPRAPTDKEAFFFLTIMQCMTNKPEVSNTCPVCLQTFYQLESRRLDIFSLSSLPFPLSSTFLFTFILYSRLHLLTESAGRLELGCHSCWLLQCQLRQSPLRSDQEGHRLQGRWIPPSNYHTNQRLCQEGYHHRLRYQHNSIQGHQASCSQKAQSSQG